METARHFVRFFDSGIQTWGSDPEKDVKCFNQLDPEHSVYEVDLEEELFAAAAHHCANPTKKPDCISMLRIRPTTLCDFGIQIGKFEFGTTCIPKWDGRHRNLVADRPQLLALIRYLSKRYLSGYECVRRIDKAMICKSLSALVDENHCPRHVVSLIAHWNKNGKKPRLTEAEIRSNLALAQFDDEFVRPIAHEYSTGEQQKDWYYAVSKIRDRYTETVVTGALKQFKEFIVSPPQHSGNLPAPPPPPEAQASSDPTL